MLQINDLTYRIGARVLFARATVSVGKGQRIGLVGPNGSGKTTLLRLIAGELHADEGTISVPARWRAAMVAQEAPGDAASLLDTVLAADRERTALLDEAETATDPQRIAEVHNRLADIDAHAAPARAAAILSGLGFDEAAQARPCSALSGGMRMRVALAATLFRAPDLLLLDEPTNHLDLEATMWLEGYLKSYPYTILLVSHDKDLLNRAVEGIIHIDEGRLVAYRGNYDRFQEARQLKLDQQSALAAKQAERRKHLQAFIDRFRYKASKARQAQSRIKELEKMPAIVVPMEKQPVRFDFPQPDPLSPPLVALENGIAGYGERPVLRNLNLRIDMDDRIALLGANGNGKSTLVKTLSGRLKLMDGKLRKSSRLRIGYFAQHQTDELDTRLTALDQAKLWMPMATEEKVRSHLGRFGFAQTRADTRIGSLSGGEKARLLFALMSREAPQLLLLDEPTNHLDVDSRQAVVDALNAYDGAVVLITHDPNLIGLVADRLWLVADGTCMPFDGDLDDYRRLIMEQRRAERARSPRERADGGNGAAAPVNRKDQRRASADARAALAPLRRKVRDSEALIERLHREKSALETRLADPALYAGASDELTGLQKSLGDIDRRLEEAETAWLEAQEALEQATA
ncbi:MAG: ATP-binding cassette domain-containing protein [Alphaproteobacteria bacterium]|jgi:ATP-binding cassette subfamily F protein 3|nr:ATP-binding cassette domain-containing protein [Alphaproteobacteria bacterium]